MQDGISHMLLKESKNEVQKEHSQESKKICLNKLIEESQTELWCNAMILIIEWNSRKTPVESLGKTPGVFP